MLYKDCMLKMWNVKMFYLKKALLKNQEVLYLLLRWPYYTLKSESECMAKPQAGKPKINEEIIKIKVPWDDSAFELKHTIFRNAV